jgi:opacity protein-like surface antigen
MFVLLALVVLVLATMGAAAAVAAQDHITVRLMPVNGSGVHGIVDLQQLSPSGTHIDVTARGLKPRHGYVSLYYDNHVCALEPYSQEDVIGGRYRADKHGIGRTSGDADDDLDEINSVSVRRASDFKLLACADVHPS